MRADYLVSLPTRGVSKRSPAASTLIVLDSDGTVLDSMKPKHDLAFAPAFGDFFVPDHPVAAREVWAFVNLGSRNRGANRYRALNQALRLLASHPGVPKRDPLWLKVADSLAAWLGHEANPTRQNLQPLAEKDPLLGRVLAWSKAVDAAIAALPLPKPFQGALRVLPRLQEYGEVITLSAAPTDAVKKEWREAGLLPYTSAILGQEAGSKSACLVQLSLCAEGRRRVLVVGDAPGDLEAARSSGAAFFPILPSKEEESWARFESAFLPLFKDAGPSPAGAFLADFLASLPQLPPWKN